MMAAERGAAAATLRSYALDLADFSAFASDAATAPPGRVRAYLAELHRRGLSAATAARRLACLRQFFRFLCAEGVRGDDPTAALEGPRRGRVLPKVLSTDEVDALLAAARAKPGVAGLRLVAL